MARKAVRCDRVKGGKTICRDKKGRIVSVRKSRRRKGRR